MAQMGRPGLTLAEKKDLWRRWKVGQSLSEIGGSLFQMAPYERPQYLLVEVLVPRPLYTGTVTFCRQRRSSRHDCGHDATAAYQPSGSPALLDGGSSPSGGAMSNGHLRPFAGGLQRPTPDDPCLPWPWHRPTRSTDRVPASGSPLRMADLRHVLLRDRRWRFPVV